MLSGTYFVQHAYYIEFLGTCLCAHGRGATAVNQIFNAWHFVKYNQFSGEPFYCDQRFDGLEGFGSIRNHLIELP